MSLKKCCLHPLFLLGFIIRLVLIAIVLPMASTEWYVPFLHTSTAQLTVDPWAIWLNQGGTSLAFPYGYVMWFVFVPLTLLCTLFSIPLIYGYSITLLAVDFALLVVLRKLVPNRDRLLLAVYWLSPIILLASYGLGLNDLIPVFLLTLAMYFTRQLRLFYAGALCIAAISAKLSMIIALPFFLIYLFHNRPMRQLMPAFLRGLAVATVLVGLPFVFSTSALRMLFSNVEIIKVYQFALNIGGDTSLYVLPLTYFIMLYAAWRVQRMNFELFQSILGVAFLLVVLLTPAAPGWFIWVIPPLVAYQAMSGVIAIALMGMFSSLYVLNILLTLSVKSLRLSYLEIGSWQLPQLPNHHISSLLNTAMTAIGIILVMRIWREKVKLNDYFRLSRRPFVIGIAGDSGSGKDTFSEALKGLFGSHSVASLSGDDYHLWDRQKPMWQVMTHLNPVANNLDGFADDLVSLTDGKAIMSRHYNHQTGKMGRPLRIKSNDFIIASGLHALYLPILRNCYNLSIYLDIDESLRRHFKFHRDVHERGHTAERVWSMFGKREPDSIRFIRPQNVHADLVLSLQPIHPHILELDDSQRRNQPCFKLLVRFRNRLNEHSLARVLIGVCGLHVDMLVSNESSEVLISIEGDISTEDIQLAAKMLCPRILEFLDIQPKWQDGMLGLMQLITLSHINQALMKRFIC